jgi:hypothetical protein
VGRKSGKAERQELKPPEGNTILHIFGSWLFDAVMQRRDGFEEVRPRASALGSASVAMLRRSSNNQRAVFA